MVLDEALKLKPINFMLLSGRSAITIIEDHNVKVASAQVLTSSKTKIDELAVKKDVVLTSIYTGIVSHKHTFVAPQSFSEFINFEFCVLYYESLTCFTAEYWM